MDTTGVGKEPSANQQVGFEEQAHKASALWCPPLPDDLTGVAMKRGDAAVESHENKFGDIHKRYATRLGVLPFLDCHAGPAKRNVTSRESQDVMVRGIPHPPGGGFVFNAIHNVQALTPTGNVVAMIEAVHEFNGTRCC
jgi:hypothetical protein